MNESTVKFKLENETTSSSTTSKSPYGNAAATKPLLDSTSSAGAPQQQQQQPSGQKSSIVSTTNDELARRFKSETVRKNWQTVLDLAMKKRNDADFFERSESVMANSSFAAAPSREIYASEKENWLYFTIIIVTVIVLSILFCYLVYSYFPSFRAQNLE